MPLEPDFMVDIDYADVKMDFLAIYDGRLKIGQPYWSREAQTRWRPGMSDWSGVRANDTARWIREGFKPPGAIHSALVSPVQRKRTRWREEGDDLDVSRAWSGDPTPFSSRESGVKAGVRIIAQMSFGASVPSAVISDYGVWLTQLVMQYQTAGHDIELTMEYVMDGHLFSHRSRSGEYRYRVILKRFGSSSDYVAWSPAFSPGGFRHIMFAQFALHADRTGRRITDTLGAMPLRMREGWGARFNGQSLTITCGYSAQHFPAEAMTRKVAAAFTP